MTQVVKSDDRQIEPPQEGLEASLSDMRPVQRLPIGADKDEVMFLPRRPGSQASALLPYAVPAQGCERAVTECDCAARAGGLGLTKLPLAITRTRVRWMVTRRASVSTSGQRRPSSSPRRMPVVTARV